MNELHFWIGFGLVMTAITCVLFYKWLELDRMCGMYALRLKEEIERKEWYQEQLDKFRNRNDHAMKALRGEK